MLFGFPISPALSLSFFYGGDHAMVLLGLLSYKLNQRGLGDPGRNFLRGSRTECGRPSLSAVPDVLVGG